MWRKRLHMDIVILPLVRNLAFTLKRWRGCGSASSSCRFSQKKYKKNIKKKHLESSCFRGRRFEGTPASCAWSLEI